MGEYTAPAIAGSLEVRKAVVSTPGWLGDAQQTGQALYSQIRLWYELQRAINRRGLTPATPN
jgi:hypothetical protein